MGAIKAQSEKEGTGGEAMGIGSSEIETYSVATQKIDAAQSCTKAAAYPISCHCGLPLR
jgi:hypothetical protein